MLTRNQVRGQQVNGQGPRDVIFLYLSRQRKAQEIEKMEIKTPSSNCQGARYS